MQAVLTKPEYYDVMGPALWPLVVAVPMLGMLLITTLFSRSSQSEENLPLSNRFWLMCLAMITLVGLQVLAIVPFFLSASSFCFCAFLLMSENRNAKALLIAGIASVVFCFGIQYLFTHVIVLDLKSTF